MVNTPSLKEIPITEGQVTFRDDFLEAIYYGPYQPTDLISLGHTLVELAQAHDAKGILVNLTQAKGSMTAMDRYELVLEMSDKWPKLLPLAVVVKPSQTLKMIGFFWERLARSKGFNTALKFDSIKAEQWLKYHINQ